MVVKQDACQQQNPRADLDDEIPYSGLVCALGSAGKYQENRGQSRNLPIDKQGDEVCRKHRTNRAADVQHGRDMLHRIAHMQRIKSRDKGGDVKDVTEGQAEWIHPHL